jgi:3-oxoacyl-[acyl-carrier-protein] synthase II
MASPRRVVLTGFGLVTPIGIGPDAFWESLRTGKSGIRSIQNFDASGLPVRVAGEIPDFDPTKIVDKKKYGRSLRMMARTIQLGVVAAQLAVDNSQLDKDKVDSTRFGCDFGTGLIATELEEMGPAAQVSANCQPHAIDLEKWGVQGIENIPPLWMLKYLPNMIACHASIIHNAQGPSNTITETDVASLLAMGEAFRIIRRDQADLFLTGGGESKINALSMTRQSLFQPLSRRVENPERACRPFDRKREGSVLGEGAAVFTMEVLEHAQKRGARIYGEVLGFGAAFDRKRDGTGLARAARAALAEAEVTPDQLDHVNAHGLGVGDPDAAEARGIASVIGPNNANIPVFAPKSYFGNMGAAAHATELAASLLAFTHGELPATLNHEEPDPACPVVVSRAGRRVSKPYVLKVGFTDLGQCAALVCRRWDPTVG